MNKPTDWVTCIVGEQTYDYLHEKNKKIGTDTKRENVSVMKIIFLR
jgi:hypothetical protein